MKLVERLAGLDWHFVWLGLLVSGLLAILATCGLVVAASPHVRRTASRAVAAVAIAATVQVVVVPLVRAAFEPVMRSIALLAHDKFFLEALVLALLVAWTWTSASRRAQAETVRR